ncbi:hypothetical protein JCM5350_007688 [Sporobolomyces pararoseus]
MFALESGRTSILVTIKRIYEGTYEGLTEPDPRIAIVGVTSLAAQHLQVPTLRQFLGMPKHNLSPTDWKHYLEENKMKVNKLKQVEVLLIDEFTRIPPSEVDRISEFLSRVRGRDSVFGGILVVATGDYYEVPPSDLSPSNCYVPRNSRQFQ